MKTKKINRKLVLKKETISNLNMSNVKGGAANPTDTFPHWDTVDCPAHTENLHSCKIYCFLKPADETNWYCL
ncbi:MAG: class I lanthipeptide [Marinifilaceae bacterium]